MRKVVFIIIVLIFISGCSSKEDKAAEYAEEMMKKYYGVEVKTTSVEGSKGNARGSAFVIILASIFESGLDLSFETVDEPVFQFTGSIQEDLSGFNETFIAEKHDYLLKHDEQYQRLNKTLLNNGFNEIKLSDGFMKNSIANFNFSGIHNGEEVNTSAVVEAMKKMAASIVEDVPYEISVAYETNLIIPANEMNDVTIQTLPYHIEDIEDLETLLSTQFEAINTSNSLNKEVKNQLKALNISPSYTLNPVEGNYEEELFDYQFDLILEEYNEDNLINAFELLRSAGMSETVVRLRLEIGKSRDCRIKEVIVVEDLEYCYQK